MWERAGAIIFVLIFPFLFLYFSKIKSEKKTSNKKVFYVTFVTQTIVMSFLVSFWIHFIPCFWMSCDGNDSLGRGILWLSSWFFMEIIFVVLLNCKPVFQIVKYSNQEELPK